MMTSISQSTQSATKRGRQLKPDNVATPIIKSARTRIRILVLALILGVAWHIPLPAMAQGIPLPILGLDADTAQDARDTTDRIEVPRESPRASLIRFFALARAGDYDSAAVYLEVPKAQSDEAPMLARQLKAVLDRYLWINLDSISVSPLGDTEDGQGSGIDRLGSIPNARGVPVGVFIQRWRHDGVVRWRFERRTVTHIPAWYEHLPDRWAIEHLPSWLLRPGPFEILMWQWLALPVLIAVAAVLAVFLRRIVQFLFQKLTRAPGRRLTNLIIHRLGRPFFALCAVTIVAVTLPLFNLYPPAVANVSRIMQAAYFIIIILAIWGVIDVVRQSLFESSWGRQNPASRSLLALGARVSKVFVIAVAVVTAASALGFNATSIIAGLGLGGLALALAAQKTVENLFGAFSIGVDQPFREGDFVRVQDFLGTVEVIGLRSTRFRTPDRTIVTIPNGQLAEMRIESFTERDRLRFARMIGIAYGASPEQLRQITAGFEAILREQALIFPDGIAVKIVDLTPSAINIEITAWFLTTDWAQYQRICQDVLLQFVGVVDKAGATFAFPPMGTKALDERVSGEQSPNANVPDTSN